MNELQAFLESRRKASQKIVESQQRAGRQTTYSVRLSIKLEGNIACAEEEIRLRFLGRRIILRSRNKGKPINSDNSVVFTASRFKTIDDAADFGFALQSSLSVSAAYNGIGVDIGYEKKSPLSFKEAIDKTSSKLSRFLFNDVHGLEIIPDYANTCMVGHDPNLIIGRNPTLWMESANSFGRKIHRLDSNGLNASLLMNAAFMSSHPAASLVLSVAAVELLAKGENWTKAQREWIDHLRAHTKDHCELSDPEKEEISGALENLNRFSISKKTRRLIERLNLKDLQPRWKALYDDRSKFVHGAYMPHSKLVQMSEEARNLAQTIVNTYVQHSLSSGRRARAMTCEGPA